LRGSSVRSCDDAVPHDSRRQPCADSPWKHGSREPQGNPLAPPLMMKVRAVPLHVRVVDGPHLARHDGIAPRLARHGRGASRPVATGARQKILRRNGTQNPGHRSLQEPVLSRGTPERPRFPVACGPLDPPPRRCLILARLEASPPLFHALLAVRCARRDGFSLHAACPCAVELAPRFPPASGRQPVRQGGKAGCGLSLRSRCDLPSWRCPLGPASACRRCIPPAEACPAPSRPHGRGLPARGVLPRAPTSTAAFACLWMGRSVGLLGSAPRPRGISPVPLTLPLPPVPCPETPPDSPAASPFAAAFSWPSTYASVSASGPCSRGSSGFTGVTARVSPCLRFVRVVPSTHPRRGPR
jgi:hypothetical protein